MYHFYIYTYIYIYVYNTYVSLEPHREPHSRPCLHVNQAPRVAALRVI